MKGGDRQFGLAMSQAREGRCPHILHFHTGEKQRLLLPMREKLCVCAIEGSAPVRLAFLGKRASKYSGVHKNHHLLSGCLHFICLVFCKGAFDSYLVFSQVHSTLDLVLYLSNWTPLHWEKSDFDAQSLHVRTQVAWEERNASLVFPHNTTGVLFKK